jgi:hypothetical protein
VRPNRRDNVRTDEAGSPHDVQLFGPSIVRLSGESSLSGEPTSCERLAQMCHVTVVESQGEARAMKQHQLALDAGEGGEAC